MSENDGTNINKANIVIFHAPTRDQSFPSFPTNRPHQSIYALVSMEQPKYARILSNFDELKNFDLLVTYSLHNKYLTTGIPNLPVTYFPLNILRPEAVLKPPKPFKDKNGYGTGVTVAVFTSNCHAAGATGRYQYVQELMQHIPVRNSSRRCSA